MKNIEISKTKKLKAISYKLNRGMTYIELIVVLSIFAVMSSIIIFNYGSFQSKVDIKNLASDAGLQVVQAQKSAIAGIFSPLGSFLSDPAYGVYFSISSPTSFIYFADLNNNKTYDTGELLNTINITKGNHISAINSYIGAVPTAVATPLSIVFTRPDSRPVFTSNGATLTPDYIQITVVSPSPNAAVAYIKIYSSGRIEVN